MGEETSPLRLTQIAQSSAVSSSFSASGIFASSSATIRATSSSVNSGWVGLSAQARIGKGEQSSYWTASFFGGNVHPFSLASKARAILSNRYANLCLLREPKYSGIKIISAWAGFSIVGAKTTSTA